MEPAAVSAPPPAPAPAPLLPSVANGDEDAAIDLALTRLIARKEELAAWTRTLSERVAKNAKGVMSPEPLIRLNVGGFAYETLRSNLVKIAGSRLEVMFSGRHQLDKDNNGEYFIDRDGSLFKHVLKYLRDDQLKVPEEQLAPVMIEFEFFAIPWPKDASASPAPPASPAAAGAAASSSPMEANIVALLDAKEARLREIEKQLDLQEGAQAKEREFVAKMNERTKDKLLLNVGGTTIATTRGTLCLFKDTMLAAMFSEGSRHTVPKDAAGRFFVDRDADDFSGVLNVLRNARDELQAVVDEEVREEMERMNLVLPDTVKLYFIVREFRAAPFIALSEGNRKATKLGGNAWNAAAVSAQEIRSGVHAYHLRLTTAGQFHFMVGFAPANVNTAAANLHTTCGWYFYAANNTLNGTSPAKREPHTLRNDALNGQQHVWTRVDMNNRTISFAMGPAKPAANKWQICFREIEVSNPVVLVTLLFVANSSVELEL